MSVNSNYRYRMWRLSVTAYLAGRACLLPRRG
jgi:hypothetical protein